MNEEIDPEQLKQLEQMKKVILRKVLSKDAIERLGRIRVIKPDLALQLELYLMQMYQAGKLKSEITDEQLKMILETLTSKKQFNILK